MTAWNQAILGNYHRESDMNAGEEEHAHKAEVALWGHAAKW